MGNRAALEQGCVRCPFRPCRRVCQIGRNHPQDESMKTAPRRGRLSTDFFCFDSTLRSIHGRCGRFAELVGNRAALEQGCVRRPFRPRCRVCQIGRNHPLAEPMKTAPRWSRLSTDFSCFDSTLRSIHGRCGRFAELVGSQAALSPRAVRRRSRPPSLMSTLALSRTLGLAR